MWIKVWQRWAHGEYKESCDYHEVSGTEDILELIQEINETHDWSDKFRGSQYEIIEAPPKKWFEKQIAFHNAEAKAHLKIVKKYQQELLVKKINKVEV